jgi:hypothetical protein
MRHSFALVVTGVLVACASRAHAGPQDIPPPEELVSENEPEPTQVETTPAAPLTERFHIEGTFLVSPLYDFVIDYLDANVHAGSRNGRGPAIGGEGAIYYRLSTAFHIGVGARLQQTTKGSPVAGHILHVPVRLAWISSVSSNAWMSYGVGAGFGRAWLTPAAQLPEGNASNGVTAEARVAFIQRMFATVDVVVSVTGWMGPLIANAFGSSGVTLGVGFRYGA